MQKAAVLFAKAAVFCSGKDLLKQVNLACASAVPVRFVARHVYTPLSSLIVSTMSRATYPKSWRGRKRWPTMTGAPSLNHSTLRFGSVTGSSLASKWARAPSRKPSTLRGCVRKTGAISAASPRSSSADLRPVLVAERSSSAAS